MENRNRQVLLKRRPTGAPTKADFDIADGPIPDPRGGEALVRGIYLSLDPYMRGRLSGARSYAKPGELGFDCCIDHRSADLGAALDRACPNGIDVYWENVGDSVQQAVFPRLNDFGRMVMCGMVSEYNDVEPRPGPNLMSVVRKRLKIQGFIVSDEWQRFGEYRAMAAPLVRSGELKYREDIVEGLDRAPEAFISLLNGRNFGKLLIKLGDDPTTGS